MSSGRDRFGAGEWTDPARLPRHLKRLHRRIQAAAQSDRDERARVSENDVDESGRVWPGLVAPKEPEP